MEAKQRGLMIFFFQAEDGIRDLTVTGVQTCALPISWAVADRASTLLSYAPPAGGAWARVKSTIAGPPVGALTASPPPTLDASWARDGIPPKPPKGMGERAHWLAALLALVPPTRWEERLGATPAAPRAAAWARGGGLPAGPRR